VSIAGLSVEGLCGMDQHDRWPPTAPPGGVVLE
jgi:hypothetical protein